MNGSGTAKNRSARRRNWFAGIRRVLILAVLVSIVMNNRERILSKVRVFNKRYLNPRTLKIAGRLNSPYAMVRHVGRRSGSVYTTPVEAVFAQSWDSFVIPLPYGVNTDWCRNVMAAGRCTITKDQVAYNVIEPTIVDAAVVFPELPALLRGTLRAFGVKKFLKVRIEKPAEFEKPAEPAAAKETVGAA
jgi:deazaflavin-dependent oxidoreductase (nitroreductase family)